MDVDLEKSIYLNRPKLSLNLIDKNDIKIHFIEISHLGLP